MFVFKAAVVGAGTMGGQIAQTIAAAGIPVVLKDIDDALVQAGLDEARNVTQRTGRQALERGKLTEEQAEAQIEEIMGRITGTTSYASFGDVDFVIEAVPEKMADQAGASSPSSTPPRRATPSSPRTPPRCRSPRSAKRPCAPRRSSASTTSTPPR